MEPIPRIPPDDAPAGPGADHPDVKDVVEEHLGRRLRGERDPHELYESNAVGDHPALGGSDETLELPRR